MSVNREYARRHVSFSLEDPPAQAPPGYDPESWLAALLLHAEHQPNPLRDCAATRCREQWAPWPCWRYQAAVGGLVAARRDPPDDFVHLPLEVAYGPVLLASRANLAVLHRADESSRIAAVLHACGESWGTVGRVLGVAPQRLDALLAASGIVLGAAGAHPAVGVPR